jgi:hypothetical protein
MHSASGPLHQSGSVVEIANCYPQAFYSQRNEVTDESRYYMRVDFPHDAGSVKNTFNSGQQLDKLMKDQLYGIKTVSTIDYVGYSKEYGCYIYGDVAIKDGTVYDLMDLPHLSLRTKLILARGSRVI